MLQLTLFHQARDRGTSGNCRPSECLLVVETEGQREVWDVEQSEGWMGRGVKYGM